MDTCEKRLQLGFFEMANLLCRLHVHSSKLYVMTGSSSSYRRQIRGDNARDLGRSTRGLAVRQQNDRLTVTGHLDGTGCDTVRYDVETFKMA